MTSSKLLKTQAGWQFIGWIESYMYELVTRITKPMDNLAIKLLLVNIKLLNVNQLLVR